MKKGRGTKHALAMSVLAMVLCIAMLIGTTFAWFTDSVTSANNRIVAGNLDVELYYQNDETTEWTKVTSETNIFKDSKWEPGHTEVIKLKIANEGSLALKYQLGVNIASEIGSVNVEGDPFMLSDYIYFGVADGEQNYADRDSAVKSVVKDAFKIKEGYTKASSLEADEDACLTMVVYMPTTVGNEANYAKGAAEPVINLGLNLFATQFTSEEDSFDNSYDKGAPWTGLVDVEWYVNNPDAQEYVLSSAEELAGLAAIVNGAATYEAVTYATESKVVAVKDNFKGKTIKLGGNINLNDLAWTPIGNDANPFLGNFDGQNYIVSNLYVSNEGWAGLIGHAGLGSAVKISNVTIVGVDIRSNRMAGAVVGQVYGNIDNCHVKDVEIKVVPNAVADGYDNGDKVGGIVGWLGDNGDNRVLSNCTATNVKVGAYRDVGGIAGYVASSTTVKGNTVTNVKVTVDQITNYYGDKDFNAGKVYGRSGSGVVAQNNTVDAESTIDITYAKNGLTLKKDSETGDVVLYLVPASVTASTVEVPNGVTTIGGYAFAYNSNVEKIVLPSTVKTLNDRAFRDTSASTVVLNEGLTNISYQAFRNASNVKNVVIPSTVTTISKEAFQNSGVTTLTVPATVTTLEYGAMRDMKNLETVTIEGNVDIPVYAFRACTELKTVYLNGTNVTFGGGSRGMIFTNTENGNGSAITVYVANEIIKERLLAADTAAKDYGGYTIVCSDTANSDGIYADENGAKYAYADDNQEISDVIVSGAQTIILPAGSFIVPDSAQGKTLTFVGNGDTQIATQDDGSYEGCDYSLEGATVTFEGVVINTDSRTYTGYARCKGTYNNCTINGAYTLYGESVFNNCTFNVTGDTYNVWTWGATRVEFNNCTFNTDGKSILVYNQSCDVYVNDCVFNDSTNGTGFTKSALETGVDGVGPKYNIYINNTEFNGFAENDKCVGYKNIVGNKNSLTDAYLNIVVDGVDVY